MNIQITLPEDLIAVLLSGLFLIPILIGIVERFKANEAWKGYAFAFAMALGVFAGIAYVVLQYSVLSWLNIGIGAAYGVVLGLAGAGLYDVGKKFSGSGRIIQTSATVVPLGVASAGGLTVSTTDSAAPGELEHEVGQG